MLRKLTTWLGVYEEEIHLFLWTVALLFIVRSGGTILDNYADAVFLKRYGVEYLPIVNMINAVATVVVMGFVAGLMQAMTGTRLLMLMFLVSGFSMAVVRAIIPFELSLIYPLMFMLKAQYGVLLALLFWNLANDLFNTQQAKRLFPLITAGGVIGQILGSFGTPWFARTLSLDNLLLAYVLLAIAGSVTVYYMARRFPSLLSTQARKGSSVKQKSSMMEEFRRVWPLVKESTLIKILVILTFVPNVVIPIVNYQFNYAVNEQFTTEDGLLEFFGYMRGVLNIISLVLLLFVGKIYGRWGLPVALMFHPFNYVLAFMSFLFRFDVISALYARMSTQILRTSINAPATAVLSGLFPASYRAMVRPFLRGTVVRLGLFLGSTLILVSDSLFHPRYLSLVALPFMLVWLTMPFWLKRRYTDILTDLVSGDMTDIKSMESADVHQFFRDPGMRRKLREDFARSSPEDCLWYGQLLKSVDDDQLNTLVIGKLDSADANTRIELMPLMTALDATGVRNVGRLALEADGREQVVAITTLLRLAPHSLRSDIDLSSLIENPNPLVKAHAAAALLNRDSGRYGDQIDGWLQAGNSDNRLAGAVAAGVSTDARFVRRLEQVLQTEEQSDVRAAVLEALHHIAPEELNALAQPDLLHESSMVREAAVAAFRVTDKEALAQLIPLLGDSVAEVTAQARSKIIEAPYQDGKQLIKALSIPRRQVREEIFRILETLDIKDLDIVRFVRDQAEGAYKYLVEARATAALSDCPQRGLLTDHLKQQGQLQVENIIRVLATQDTSGRMRIVSRGLMSSDARQQANSQEALGDLLDNSVARVVIPLIDASPMDQKIAAGHKHFKLGSLPVGGAPFIEHLLNHKHWVTRVLALEVASCAPVAGVDSKRLIELIAQCDSDTRYENKHISRAAWRLIPEQPVDTSSPMNNDETKSDETAAETSMTISEKILLLKHIDIFAGLSVSELSAIASVTEEVEHKAGVRVIQQGDTGDTLFLITGGKVAVVKKLADSEETELDQMGSGDYFGEMALFEDTERSASIVTLEDTGLLFLHKQEFNDMVREYPQIALAICNALSERIRKLHERLLTGA